MNSLQSRAMNCGPLSEMIRGSTCGTSWLAAESLRHQLLAWTHADPNARGEEATKPIQNAAHVMEGTAQVNVGNVDMPVLMRLQRLLKTGSLARRLVIHRDNNPACLNTRQTLAGLTSTTSAASIVNVSRRLRLPFRGRFYPLRHVLLCPGSLNIISTQGRVQGVVRLPQLLDRTSPPRPRFNLYKIRPPEVRRAGPLVSLNRMSKICLFSTLGEGRTGLSSGEHLR
jgi:hypothetical protein